MTTNPGQFKKGADPRRHKLTREDCQKGFWAAIESIVIRYPDAVDSSRRHMAVNFLKNGDEPMNQPTIEQKIRRKVREIHDHVSAGKPCYWDVGEKRYRVFCARMSKGKFQVMPLASRKWLNASIDDRFELYR